MLKASDLLTIARGAYEGGARSSKEQGAFFCRVFMLECFGLGSITDSAIGGLTEESCICIHGRDCLHHHFCQCCLIISIWVDPRQTDNGSV